MFDRPTHCKAIREHNGDYVCNQCGLQWDADDDDPPKCRKVPYSASAIAINEEIKHNDKLRKSKQATGKSVIEKLKEDLKQ